MPNFDLRPCGLREVAPLFAKYHGYKSSSAFATYAFAVYEQEQPIAAFLWQPPPLGGATNICRECPQGVLALSRMVAVPKTERALEHISKPLRHQMKRLIDRSRWPVLVTYSDEGPEGRDPETDKVISAHGHSGNVYKCSGWQRTARTLAPTFTVEGRRVSRYTGGKARVFSDGEAPVKGLTWIQRWEHWLVPSPSAVFDLRWHRVAVSKADGTPRRWRSGAQAYTFVRREIGG